MEGRSVDNITEATPEQVDTEIAELSLRVTNLRATRERVVDHVLSVAGLRVYVPATWTTRHSSYKIIGTFDEAVQILREYNIAYKAAWKRYDNNGGDWQAARFPKNPSEYSSRMQEHEIDEAIEKRDNLDSQIDHLLKQISELEAEWVRRGRWSRMFLVTSSAGHIHESVFCKTCKFTTTFGWMPEFSGLSQSELLAKLGSHAEMACTVCYPDAPVRDTKKKLTAAKAAKMIAGPVLTD